MAPYSLTPASKSLVSARLFLASLDACKTYVWVGRHMPEAPWPASPVDDSADLASAYRTMILGKHVPANEAALVVRRVDWETGSEFASYDDGDGELHTKDFYAYVNAGSWYHAWKVLDNAANGVSTVTPDVADVDPEDLSYRTSDGYQWKYLFSASQDEMTRFASGNLAPVFTNASVVSAAVAGAVDAVAVDSAGEGYDNYLSGTFSASDLRVDGNSRIYSVGSNGSANTVAGFYTGCVLYVSGGTGSGQHRTVTDYFTNGNGRFAVIETEFSIAPGADSEWELSPLVLVTGDGVQSVNAEARALVNSAGNTVWRVEVLSRGAGYRVATASVVANDAVGVLSAASVRPVLPPPGGHGYDPAMELYCTAAALHANVGDSEANSLPQGNDFRSLGLLRDPLFTQVELGLANASGAWLVGEIAVGYSSILADANVSVNASSAVIGGTDLSQKISEGTQVVLVSTDGSVLQLATVDTVTNSTSAVLASNGWFSNASGASLRVVTGTSNGIVTDSAANSVTLDHCESRLATDGLWRVVGATSGAGGTVNTVTRAGSLLDFSEFRACTRVTGELTVGSFAEDEVAYQGTSASNATSRGDVHSATGASPVVIYVTNATGTFDGVTVTGANSGAAAAVTEVSPPEIEHGSGEILYAESVDAVTRSPGQSQRFQVVIEF